MEEGEAIGVVVMAPLRGRFGEVQDLAAGEEEGGGFALESGVWGRVGELLKMY